MSTQSINTEVAGTVWKVLVKVGDEVHADQELVIIESMKMEIPALAPCRGVVSELLVGEGEPVDEGQTLVKVLPA